MEKDGITILTGCTVSRVDKHGEEFTTHLSNGSSIASDQVMFAIGRHPAIANLGLETTGVAINPDNGGIAVDSFSKTSVPSHLRHRRRHQSHQPHAGRDPRGPRLRRHRVRQADRRGRSHQYSDRGVLPARGRHRRPHGSRGPREIQPRRYLQDQLPADEGDDVRPRHPRADEAGGRRINRPRRRLPHRRRRRGGNGAGDRHRREDEGDQGGFRRDDGVASDRGGRTGDDADGDDAVCQGSGSGVGALH